MKQLQVFYIDCFAARIKIISDYDIVVSISETGVVELSCIYFIYIL